MKKITDKCAILVQGKYIKGFTYETIVSYLANFKDVAICLSIWEEDKKEFNNEINELLKNSNVHVVTSELPFYSGYQNVNYQMVSTYNGLKYLNKLNCEIVLKTRTDFRVENNKIFNFYKSLNKDVILGIETVDIYKVPYFVADFVLLGNIKKLMLMFYPNLQECNDQRIHKGILKKHFIAILNSEYLNLRNDIMAERYLVFNFLKGLGYIIPSNMFQKLYMWNEWLVLNFCLVDNDIFKLKHIGEYDSLLFKNFKFDKHTLIVNNKINLFTKTILIYVKQIFLNLEVNLKFIIKCLVNFKNK